MTLTGKMRFQLAVVWMKRGRPGDLEEFIKTVCTQKNITYKAPVKKEKR